MQSHELLVEALSLSHESLPPGRDEVHVKLELSIGFVVPTLLPVG